ncbi:MAG TPA: asparagine synthase-related protein [Rhizomicrobium sp.]|jgi:asparagine synthase (glutamine-hydrolysing)|nr:asparagine synthase-related protein [Rhizomicrobium sp.]
MSAIFGFLRFDGGAAPMRDLERMGNTLAHRGPDGRKSVAEGVAGLGHCLMRVTREDQFEAQPLRDAQTGVLLVADARLDNREDLAAGFGIGAEALRDMPDSALVLRAYGKWGAACAEHLLGDFAFAIWDKRRQALVLGRDHMGQRGLYYHVADGFIAFASEIKALWALADVPRVLREEEIARYMITMREGRALGETLYDGIHGLVGGAVLTVSAAGDTQLRRYWEPRADPAHADRDETYYIETYRRILAEAVECRLRRLTAPAALLLSAGFDSAAIAGLARPVVEAQRRRLIALSMVVSESHRGTRGDIRRWVEACRRVMPHLDIRYVVGETQSPLAGLEQQFLANDGPAPATHGSYRRAFDEAAAAGARVMMNGIGGDYTVNPRGHEALARWLKTGRLRRFLAELGPHKRLTGQSAWTMLRSAIVGPLLPRGLSAAIRRRRGGDALDNNSVVVRADFLAGLLAKGAVSRRRRPAAIPPTEMRRRIAEIAREVAATASRGMTVPAAAHGLEFTWPFHDKRVVEFGLAIPEDLYVKDGRNRYLACRALGDIYPPEFHDRGRENDGMTADFPTMLEDAAPALRAELARMEANGRLASFLDFSAARRLLFDRGGQAARWAEQARALRGILIARYVEWFERGNR